MSTVLEILDELSLYEDIGPEYVVLFTPPELARRYRGPGWWDLLTTAEFNSGSCAPDSRMTEAGPDVGAEFLTAWTGALLGFPVILSQDSLVIDFGRRFARSLTVPLYWVRRNS